MSAVYSTIQKEVIGDCILYCGDARVIVPTLAQVDAVITDPPYHGLKGGTVLNSPGNVAVRRHQTITVGSELGEPEIVPIIRHLARYGAIVFTSFHGIDATIAALGGKRLGLVVWYKHGSPPPRHNVPWYCNEYAWVTQYSPGITWRGLRTHYDFPLLQAGCIAQERICEGGKAVHPAQKPLALMKALLCPGMQSICDPYMGLGTTGVACVEMGRKFVGIEIEQKYFDISCHRIEQAYAQPALLPAMSCLPLQQQLFATSKSSP